MGDALRAVPPAVFAALSAPPPSLAARAAEIREIEDEQARLRQITGCTVDQAHKVILVILELASGESLEPRTLWNVYFSARQHGASDAAAWDAVEWEMRAHRRRVAGL